VTGLIITVFVFGYLAIASEHRIHFNKAASALFIVVVCWTLYMISVDSITPESSVPDWFAQKIGHGDHSIGDLNREY